ncbi:MAG: FlgD immunoglobulin-like domain containing protein [Candidatus Krumholzibacteriaceae bacterium]|jgi:hypothetical protein
MSLNILGGVFIVTLLLSTGISGATLTVRQDGSGDFLSIPPAYAAAFNGDTIDVGPGTYADSVYSMKQLVFVGSSGAAATILDAQGTHRIIVFQTGSSGSVMTGFTLKRGMGSNGGAVRVQEGTSVVMRNCIFADNVSNYDGGAFFVRHAGTHLTLEDCTFTGNHAAHNGGAGNIIEAGTLDVTRCVFRGNSTDLMSGGVAAHATATMNVTNCLFDGNSSGDVAGAVYYYYSSGSVRNNTLNGNSSPGLQAGTIVIQASGSVVVEKNIISNALTGFGLRDVYSWMPHSCNLYWNNAAGDLGGSTTVLDPTEIHADPIYCNAPIGDFTVAYTSPAAPAHNSCGVLIGAYPPACGTAPPETHRRLRVRQDGSGDYLTISAAYAAASACCDTIDVGPGTYADSVYSMKQLVVIGSSGASATILDGQGTHRIIVFQTGSSGSVVSGFTFKRGMGDNGGAMRVQEGTYVVMRNCIFADNVATYDGAAFFVRHPGTHLMLEDCTFTGNHSTHNGGAGNIIEAGTLDVTRCVFRGNSTDVVSGAVAAHNYATMNVTNCLFDGNSSGDVAGAIYYYISGGSVRNNTLSGNSSPGLKAGSIVIQNSGGVVVERNIISNAHTGFGLWDELSYMPHTCNLYWNNGAGDLGGSTTALDPTEVNADPIYCNALTGDFTVAYTSPAAPAHNSCGVLIGAYPPACVNAPPETHRRLRVRQDGSGDFLTIPPAYAAASACCDTIDVGPGTYTDSLYTTKRLVFIGSSGAGVTILDGQGTHRIFVFQSGSSGTEVSGFTFKRGMGDNGGAMRVQEGTSVLMRNCLFVNNVATYDGAAFFVRHPGTHLTLEDCTFTGNHSTHNGGAGNIIETGTLDVTRCVFRGNSTDVVSGAVAAHMYATMNVTNCLFDGNSSGDVAGAVYYYYSTGVVRSNTFNGNTSPGTKAATVLIHFSPTVVLERNIISNDHAGCGFWDLYSSIAHSCNLYWSNADGPTGGGASLDSTEISADPLYCNAPAGDYAVAYTSPAAPEHNSCGVLIGAFPPACSEEIATLLQSYSAARKDNAIAVRWSLSEGSDAPAFTVSRAKNGDDFIGIPGAGITITGRTYCFVDSLAEPGASYRYRIEYRSAGITRQLFETEAIAIPAMPVTLFQNYPNPFNPATAIKFYLPKPADVKLDVYDISGRLVETLAHSHMSAGNHEVEWQGTNLNGNKVSSGAYFYRLRAGKHELVRKMILLR